MNTDSKASIAELNDKCMQRVAVLAVLLAVTSFASAVQRMVTGELLQFLNWAEKGSVIVVLAFLLIAVAPLFLKKMAHRSPGSSSQGESFINDIVLKSFGYAWFVTFLSCVLANTLLENYINSIPAESLLEFMQAILVGVYGICFIFLDRSETGPADFDNQ